MFNNIKKFINNSFFMNNIDNISYFVLLLLLFCAVFSSSDAMGIVALFFSFLVVFKLTFNFNKNIFSLEKHEKALIIYFLIVTLSLFASTLFKLSLHGYIKTCIYILFFFCVSLFFKQNKNKIFPTFLYVAALMSYETFIAILQNVKGVSEISGWQDMSHINPEQVVSRAYGTLKPYNPNLLAGYLLCGLSSFVYLILTYLNAKKKRIALINNNLPIYKKPRRCFEIVLQALG